MTEFLKTLTEEEVEVYNTYSKEAIYEAYITEHTVRVRLNEQLNEARRELIRLRHSITMALNEK